MVPEEEEEEEAITRLGKIIIGVCVVAFVFLLLLICGTIWKKRQEKYKQDKFMIDKNGYKVWLFMYFSFCIYLVKAQLRSHLD